MSRAAEHRSRLPPRLHRPGLGRPHFHHHLVHGRERRRTGSQGNSNQLCVTRCEITHAQALAQAGFPNGINAVSSPPQCHLSPSLKSRDPALRFCRPTDDFLLRVCLVQSAGCPRPPRPISRAGSRALDRAHSIQRIESFTAQAPRPRHAIKDNVLPLPLPCRSMVWEIKCQAGVKFDFDILFQITAMLPPLPD